MAMPMGRAALKLVMRETGARATASRDGLALSAGHARRGEARSSHSRRAAAADPDHHRAAVRLRGARRSSTADGIAVVTQPDQRWGRCDIKTTQLLPNLLAKTEARKAGAYEAWLVDRRRLCHRRRLDQCLDRRHGRPTVVTRELSQRHPAGRHPPRDPGGGRRGAAARSCERKFTVAEALKAREAFLSSATGAAMPVVAIDGKPIGDGTPGTADPADPGALCRRIGAASES